MRSLLEILPIYLDDLIAYLRLFKRRHIKIKIEYRDIEIFK